MKEKRNDVTRHRLIKHAHFYPMLEAEDVFKYVFQSALGCEHLVTDEAKALEYINREYKNISLQNNDIIEKLDGEYSRVNLAALTLGLSPKTLARLFCLSAKEELCGKALIEEKLEIAMELVKSGDIPLSPEEFEQQIASWKEDGYPAVHHSDTFRAFYRPAYRVIANKYADFIDVFAKIDALLSKGDVIVAIEGGSASGKTTLAKVLKEVYDCNVFHMDDFFLRPEQRTPERFLEVGGNVDRERFSEEVLTPLLRNEEVHYRPFDCSKFALGDEITVLPKPLTIIEGVYSTHPAFGKYYDVAFFLDVSPDLQRQRISKRNTQALAKRFFEEWIPLENRYFNETKIRSRLTETIIVSECQ